MAFRQELKIQNKNAVELARKYYSMLLALNNEHLPPKEIDLLAFTAVRGKINTRKAKSDFEAQYSSPSSSMSNMISRLTRKGYFVKKNGQITVNPSILFDFESGCVININCYVGTETIPA